MREQDIIETVLLIEFSLNECVLGYWSKNCICFCINWTMGLESKLFSIIFHHSLIMFVT